MVQAAAASLPTLSLRPSRLNVEQVCMCVEILKTFFSSVEDAEYSSGQENSVDRILTIITIV